ncbi:MAG: ArdC family protein [Caulobacteraceae bacterium]|nr:ArdC family protein [Caulobacteraceae bacterium]
MSDTHCVAQRRDIAADITAKILASLNAGVMPWRKPWDGARTGLALPRRATGECYRGVNTIMLWFASAARGYASPYWLTFNQAIKLGRACARASAARSSSIMAAPQRTALAPTAARPKQPSVS